MTLLTLRCDHTLIQYICFHILQYSVGRVTDSKTFSSTDRNWKLFFWKIAALHPSDRFHPDLWNLKPSVSHLEDGEGVQTWSEVAGRPVYFVSCVCWCEAESQDVCVRVCVCVSEFCVLTYHWTLTINPDNLWTLKWGLLRICSEKSEPYLKLYCLSLSAVTTIEKTLCAGATFIHLCNESQRGKSFKAPKAWTGRERVRFVYQTKWRGRGMFF